MLDGVREEKEREELKDHLFAATPLMGSSKALPITDSPSTIAMWPTEQTAD